MVHRDLKPVTWQKLSFGWVSKDDRCIKIWKLVVKPGFCFSFPIFQICHLQFSEVWLCKEGWAVCWDEKRHRIERPLKHQLVMANRKDMTELVGKLCVETLHCIRRLLSFWRICFSRSNHIQTSANDVWFQKMLMIHDPPVYTPAKLTWPWKNNQLKMYFQSKISHSSLPSTTIRIKENILLRQGDRFPKVQVEEIIVMDHRNGLVWWLVVHSS